MKKIFILFILVLFAFSFSKANAFFVTESLVNKATLDYGVKFLVCSVNTPYTSKELFTEDYLDFEKNIDEYYKLAYTQKCEGLEESLISANIIYDLKNNKKAEDYIYIYDDKIYSGDDVFISTKDLPNNDPSELNYDPSTLDYIKIPSFYNVDPSLPNGGRVEVSGSGIIWHNADWNKLFDGLVLSEDENSALLPLFVYKNKIYKLVDFEKTISNVVLLDYSDRETNQINTPMFEEELFEFSGLVYQGSEFIEKKYVECGPNQDEMLDMCNADHYIFQTTDEAEQIEKYYKDAQDQLQIDCDFYGTIDKYDYYYGECRKGNLKTSVNIENSEEIVNVITLINYVAESEESTSSELNGFPKYPDSIFIDKMSPNQEECFDDSIYSSCTSDVYYWSSDDSPESISSWFLKNVNKYGWECDKHDYDDYVIVSTACKKDNLEYGLSISDSYDPDGQIKVFIPDSKKIALLKHPSPQSSEIINGFPLYPKSSFSSALDNPICKRIDVDPVNCGMTTKKAVLTGDKRNEVKKWYLSVQESGWECRDSMGSNNNKLNEFTRIVLYCDNNSKNEASGSVSIKLDKNYANTEVELGIDYKYPDNF